MMIARVKCLMAYFMMMAPLVFNAAIAMNAQVFSGHRALGGRVQQRLPGAAMFSPSMRGRTAAKQQLLLTHAAKDSIESFDEEDQPDTYVRGNNPAVPDRLNTADLLSTDPHKICQEIEYTLNTFHQISIIHDNYLNYPWLLDCIRMDSGGDLLGLTHAIFIQHRNLDRNSIVKLVERAAIAGNLELIQVVMMFNRIDKRFFQSALMLAVLNRQLEAAVELREFGVPFDSTLHFCPLLRGRKRRFDFALELIQYGLVSVAEVYGCLHKNSDYRNNGNNNGNDNGDDNGDDEDEMMLTSEERHRINTLLEERRDFVSQLHSRGISVSADASQTALALFRHYLQFSLTLNPMIFTCQFGDSMLLTQMELYDSRARHTTTPEALTLSSLTANRSSRQFSRLSEFRRFELKLKIVEAFRSAASVQLSGGDIYEYLAEAIKYRRNNIVVRLLKLFLYSPQQLHLAETLASQMHNNEAVRIIRQLGDLDQLSAEKYEMRLLLSSASADNADPAIIERRVSRALDYDGYPLPRLTYLDVVRNLPAETARRVCETILEHEDQNRADSTETGAYEAMEWLVSQRDLGSFDLLMLLLRRSPTSAEQLERLIQRMAFLQNFEFIRWSLWKPQMSGLDLGRLLEFNLLSGQREAAKIFADFINDSYVLFSVYERLPEYLVEERQELMNRISPRLERKFY